MRILVVANHYAVCSARYAADAFTRLGHEVKHIGAPMGRMIWGMEVPQVYVWTPDACKQDEDWLCADFPAELVVVMDSNPDTLNFSDIWVDGAPVVVWGVDNHVRDYRRPWFAHYFLAHKAVSIQPYDDHTTWLPCAYDPHWFTPSPIAWHNRAYDVCMIGVMYPARWELVNAMRAAGLKVLAGMGLIYEAYRDAYWNSRVSLCVSAAGDVGQRIFETAALGCAVLSDPIADLEAIDAQRPIKTYRSIEEAVEFAWYMQHDSTRWLACAAWVPPHTFDARCETLLATCKEKGIV